MQDDDLFHRLSAHKVLSAAPAEELRWLAARGRLRHVEPGDVVAASSEPIETLNAVLSGHIAIHVKRGGASRKTMDWRAGELSGILPYSRLKAPPGTTIAIEPTDLFVLHRDHFPALIRECHEVTSICVHVMLDRARHFTTTDFHDEKMFALGKLAAGLAHELNNPASAVARSASALTESVIAIDRAARELAAATLSSAQLGAIQQLHAFTAAHAGPVYRQPLERADDEEAIANWLSDRRITEEPAAVLADLPQSLAALERVESVLDRGTLETVVEYIAAEYTSRRLAGDIERAAARISNLIAAVKRFTYMDQATAPKPIDLVAGLQDTMLVLTAKARSKAVMVSLDAPPDLPAIQGFGGELNQVWTNLIDNAIDAAPKSGHVRITVTRGHESVCVNVVDDGPGIPEAIQGRIFDPFFTTKPVGEGTGLGLDIAKRIVQRHEGDIDVSSVPGHTEFHVRLPVADASQQPAPESTTT